MSNQRELILEFEHYKMYVEGNDFFKSNYTLIDEVRNIWWIININILYATYYKNNKIPYDVKITILESNSQMPVPFEKLKNIFLFLKTKSVIFKPY